jgi:hypothetical protein
VSGGNRACIYRFSRTVFFPIELQGKGYSYLGVAFSFAFTTNASNDAQRIHAIIDDLKKRFPDVQTYTYHFLHFIFCYTFLSLLQSFHRLAI